MVLIALRVNIEISELDKQKARYVRAFLWVYIQIIAQKFHVARSVLSVAVLFYCSL